MASAEREPITGVSGGIAPSGGQGRGLRVHTFCYPTRPVSERELPVPTRTRTSNFLPDPTRGFTRYPYP